MDFSVLVIGGELFLSKFGERYGKVVTNSVTIASLPTILTLIESQYPQILILPAQEFLKTTLWQQLPSYPQLNQIYFIVVEDGEKCDLIEQKKMAVQVLEKGADLYLPLSLGDRIDSEIIAVETQLLQSYIQLGLRQIQQYQELRETNDFLSTMALADPLTQLSNRRALEWELPRQIESARSHNTPLSLIILDVDYFKSVNDNYGHLVGDRILQLLSSRLSHNLRVQDTIFRYGGEEFVVILGQTNQTTALKIAQRLRQMVGEQVFNVDRNLSLKITISLGLTDFQPSDDDQGISLLRRADENLLKAKSQGRNQVVCE
ncbi:MAG: GGDEF domain-containing protein [Chroococcales cyanobacterium]